MTQLENFTCGIIVRHEHMEEEGNTHLIIAESPQRPLIGAQTSTKYDPGISPRIDVIGADHFAKYQLRVPGEMFEAAVSGILKEDLKGLMMIFTAAHEQNPLDHDSSVLTVGSFNILPPPESVN